MGRSGPTEGQTEPSWELVSQAVQGVGRMELKHLSLWLRFLPSLNIPPHHPQKEARHTGPDSEDMSREYSGFPLRPVMGLKPGTTNLCKTHEAGGAMVLLSQDRSLG